MVEKLCAWMDKVRCLGVYVSLVSSKVMSCNYDNKTSFYREFNTIYGKVGRLASVNIVVELLKTKYRYYAYIIIWFRCMSGYPSHAA